MIRAFSRHLRMLQPSIHSPGELLVVPMGLGLVFVLGGML
jgi:hypothetical protein